MTHYMSARTIAQAPASERLEFLKGVFGYTVAGLAIAAVSGVISANVLAPALLSGRMVYFVVVLGAMFGAQYFGHKLASGPTPQLGLLVGSGLMGLAMGPMLLMAYAMGLQGPTGSGLSLIGQAMGLTILTAGGMVGYVWTEKRDFSMLRAGLSALMLPLIVLMVVSFFVPALSGGGTLSLMLSGGFILVSAGAMLYELNTIIHTIDTEHKVLAAVMLTMSVLILFWNILIFLMKLQSRD
jgi:FtsH-binding integral membrane protein